jgi:phospholipase/carboxylesterase
MTTPFVFRHIPGSTARTLLLLHGTGGNESDLLPIGRAVAPDATLLSPRGKVLEGSMPRFFRRLAEGVFDQADLVLRTDELAAFVREQVTQLNLDPAGVTAVGFSNGANITASLLFRHPGLLSQAVLWRAMVPFESTGANGLAGTRVRLGEGRFDPIVPVANAERLAQLLRSHGAEVTLDWREAGHQLQPGEVEEARAWLEVAAP